MEKFKRVGAIVKAFMFLFFLSAVPVYQLVNVLSKASTIDIDKPIVFTLIISSLIALLATYLSTISEIWRSLWFSENCVGLLCCYTMLVVFLYSIKLDVCYSYEEMKSFIELQWTIFSISITVFVVWNALVLPFIDGKKPQGSEFTFPVEKAIYIERRRIHTIRIKSTFMLIPIVFINLIVLLFSTASIFVKSTESSFIVGQNLMIFSFYLCTNTLLILLDDIVRPLIEAKGNRLKETKVTKEDIEFVVRFRSGLAVIPQLIEAIDKSTAILPEQKEKIIMELLSELVCFKEGKSADEDTN